MPSHFATPDPYGTLSEKCAWGQLRWVEKFSRFAQQWTQPALMALAEDCFQEKVLHSSQIHGWSTGKLRDPSPKAVLVIGALNLAIAQANGEIAETEWTLSDKTSALWEGKRPMRMKDGTVMGPAEVFACLTAQAS